MNKIVILITIFCIIGCSSYNENTNIYEISNINKSTFLEYNIIFLKNFQNQDFILISKKIDNFAKNDSTVQLKVGEKYKIIIDKIDTNVRMSPGDFRTANGEVFFGKLLFWSNGNVKADVFMSFQVYGEYINIKYVR